MLRYFKEGNQFLALLLRHYIFVVVRRRNEYSWFKAFHLNMSVNPLCQMKDYEY